MTLLDNYLELTLTLSKTDSFRNRVTLSITSALDDAYPISSLRNLFERFPSDPFLLLFNPGKPFIRKLVTDILRTILRGLRYSGNYSSHSFRRGAATSVRDIGLSNDEI